jgi:hypothetical protein
VGGHGRSRPSQLIPSVRWTGGGSTVRYDPTEAPDPSEWLASDEAERLDAVLRYHKRAKEKAGSWRAHAAIHAAVETQLAEGLGGAVRAMERLVGQGLDRHEAVHAIGSVVAAQLYAVLQHRAFDSVEYEARLDALTADSWRLSADET